jgi:hypothetical protein
MSKPKLKSPPVPDPAPVPVASAEAGDDAAKKLRKSGWTNTILTGALAPQTQKKSVLG